MSTSTNEKGESTSLSTKEEPYRVIVDDSHKSCTQCGEGKFWTVVHGRGEDEFGIGTSWGDEELANDVCDLMNMALDRGRDEVTVNAEEEKLVAFFRGDGERIGRAGDYDELSPAETAIRAMRNTL